MLRIFFTADLHGSDIVYNKLINAASFYKIKYIFVGGDLAGKVLVPIVKEGNNYSLNLFGEQKKLKESELADAEKEIRESGEYYKVMERDEYENIIDDNSKMLSVFKEQALLALKQFVEKAESRLGGTGAKIFMMPGNDDFDEIAEFLKSSSSTVIENIDELSVDIEGYNFVGYGYSNITPWHTQREKDEDHIYSDLSRICKSVNPEKSVFVLHVPPFNTTIDRAPKLGKDMSQSVKFGSMQTESVGSTSVRRIIEELAPIAGLHGHVHEANGIDYVKAKNGKLVPVLNPGSSYSSGTLNGIIIDFEKYALEKYTFTRG